MADARPAPAPETAALVTRLCDELAKVLVGQDAMAQRLIIGLLCRGHLLLEGMPGLAKTLTVRSLAEAIDTGFSRIQFTPDMLPADVIGTEIFNPREGSYSVKRGPVFSNLVLADEINRAPAKVQAALLEVMQERQVTIAGTSYRVEDPFLVLATQNPIEQEGTYRLPEAQLDRFLMYVRVGYPSVETEREILRLARGEARGDKHAPSEPLSQQAIFAARQECLALHLDESLENYIVQLVHAGREPAAWGDDLARWIEFGASPRGSIALERCARAHAWLHGRDYVSPDDIQAIAPDVLRHRILLSFEAEADGVDADRVVSELLARVPVG